MNIKKFLTIILTIGIIISIIFISSCRTDTEQKQDIIRLGMIGPLTGGHASAGHAMKRGIEIAVEITNDSGGVLGKEVVPIFEDSKIDASTARNAINKLINIDRVQAIIGAAASGVTLAIAPIANNNEVVLISPISTADSIRDSGEYIFRVVPPNMKQGTLAASFTYEYLDARKAAVLYVNNDFGKSLSAAFISEFTAKGGEIVIQDNYMIDAVDHRDVLTKIKNAKPDIIFLPGTDQDTAIVVRQARELGIDNVIIGSDGSVSPRFIEVAGDASKNCYFTSFAIPTDETQEMQRFKEMHQKKYNESPDIYSYYTYDATMVVLEAIRISGEYNGKKIKDALLDISLDGLTGLVEFDEFGEIDRDYSIYKVEDGDFIVYKN